MKDIAERLRSTEREMAAEMGPFRLFALFLRENSSLGRWDLVVSAPWIESDKGAALTYIISKLKEALTLDEFLKLSRIVPIDQSNPGLDAVQKAVQVEHGLVHRQNDDFFGLSIEQAYIVTSRRQAA